MTVDAIKEAIAELPADDRLTLAAWLNEFDYDEWDQKLVRDFSPGGRATSWAQKVKSQIAEGKATLVDHGFEESFAKHEASKTRS